jgi:hypothetical protein
MTETLPAHLRLLELRQENERLRRAKALREENGIAFYQPHWKQHKFHVCQATGRYGRTGNRFGKSQMGTAEDVAWALGYRPWYQSAFEIKDGVGNVRERHVGGRDHPYVTVGIPQRPVKVLILCENWKKAKSVFTNRDGSPDMQGKLFKLIPKSALGKITRSTGGDIIQIEVKRPAERGGGTSIIRIDTVQSYKNSPQSAESDDWDLIHVDEPCPEDMFIAHARGLMDRNGSYMFTCTPVIEMWINDKFTPPGRTGMEGELDLRFEEAVEGGRLSKYIITGSVFDNPYRTPAGVAEFMSSLNEEDKQCRIYGYPLALAGAVYREFIYDMHVLCDVPKGWKEYWLPPKDYTIRVAWDVHGAKRPQAILLVATAPDGTVFVYDEMFYEPLIKPNAELLKQKVAPYFVADQLIDPRACIVNPVTGTADVLDALAEYDLYFDKGSKDMMAGISATKERLLERHVVTKLPTIYFSPKLKETLYEFSHYVYDMDKNVPIDKDDHMMENLRRLVLSGLEYSAPPSAADWAAINRVFTIKHNVDRAMSVPQNLHL